MKYAKKIFITIVFILAIVSCSEQDSIIENQKLSNQRMKEFTQQLLTDRSFHSYLEQVRKSQTLTVKSNANYDLVTDDLNNILSQQDFDQKIRLHFESPEQTISNFKQIHSKSILFWISHEALKSVTEEQQQSIFRNAIEQIVVTEVYSKSPSKSALVATCQAQYNSDIQSCREGAYTAAAFCGLLSPTLVLALACGAAVVAGDIVCLKFVIMITLSTEKKIKLLEYISYMCAIIPVFFMKMQLIVMVGLIGLVFQLPIFLLYRSINRQGVYLKNKGGALIVGSLIIGFLLIKYQVFN